ncbi:cholesterol transport system auxiliary component [Rhizobium rosettiformans]|jgi:cholesterol transport system auxiliary component|nr:cholesterol transport system auxiliary component [Rhizobium rosettiformans]
MDRNGASEFSVMRLRRLLSVTALVPALGLGLAACGSKAVNDTFDLTASVSEIATPASARNRQLLVADPSALKALDSEQILVRVSGAEIQYLSQSQWSDRLTRVVQSKLVEAFENTNRLGGVGKPGQGLAIDYQLITDVRAFEISAEGADRGVVEISAKLLNDRNGTVRAQRVFRAEVPSSGTDNAAYVAALDRAFARVTADIVGWTLQSM